MRRWPTRGVPWLPLGLRWAAARETRRRVSSTSLLIAEGVDVVEVPCGSAGSIELTLHNLAKHGPSAPLLLYVPPFGASPQLRPAVLPPFLAGFPAAIIHYRWAGSSPFSLPPLSSADSPASDSQDADFSTPLCWPNPIHDLLYGYSWLSDNLAPTQNGRRDVYVYGSHLGASLATSLALTESHPHQRMGIRGLAAWNGIYNWTMLLPDHKVNQATKTKAGRVRDPPPLEAGSQLDLLQRQLPGLFRTPANLFDPFASPILFFQTSGMLVPRSFNYSEETASMVDALSSLGLEDGNVNTQLLAAMKAPRRGSLVFPPRMSTLKIPQSLFLYDVPPAASQKESRRRKTSRSSDAEEKPRRKTKPKGFGFEVQANELAELMRRSVSRLELKARSQWDEDLESWEDEAARRVGVAEAGVASGDWELSAHGQEVLLEWLTERIKA